MQGNEGDNYLIGITNGSNPDSDPKVPGKKQSVISFAKKKTPGIQVSKGDGFPSRVLFNGEECSIPTRFPVGSGSQYHKHSLQVSLVVLLTLTIIQILY
ncbi:hypothetical protein L6164_035860 [Bauhinia variegata]|uniref:Uncharacterized protein n=1 Tax=Bauhinia variegata TaxID=167791 RepID=A0ACB9KFE1_BAUVA|nr:hypothetical protein L6164_035860 [Bauhinia variegata]